MRRIASGMLVLVIDASQVISRRRGADARNAIRLRRYAPVISLSRAKNAFFLALEMLQSTGND